MHSLAVDLGNSTRSPPIVLGRSDRLSKQKERMRTSIADTAVNSAVLSQQIRHDFFPGSNLRVAVQVTNQV